MTLTRLLKQPTYKNLDTNFETIKQDLITLIQNYPKSDILQGALEQSQKGLVKYNRLIDDNPDFEPLEYLKEEIFDAFVYLSNLQIQNKTKT